MSDLFGFKKKVQRFDLLRNVLPTLLGNKAKNFFIDSFAKQGFTDSSLEKWSEVQRRTPGTPAYKYPKKKKLGRRTKAININSGRTRRSIRVKYASFARTVVGSVGVPYAKYVNNSRQFLGDSKILRRELTKIVKKEMDKVIKGK